MTKLFRVTVGARCYDTYKVEAEDAVEAFRKVREYDGQDDAVEEENLGEVSGTDQDYKIDDLISVQHGEEDHTADVQEALLRETGAFRVVTEARSDDDEACWDLKPHWFVLWVTKELLERIEALYHAVKAMDAYEISEFCYRGQWLRETGGEGLSEEEILEKLDEGSGVLDQRSLNAQTLAVNNTGEFRFGGYIKHTNCEVVSERLKIAEIREKFNLKEKKD